MAQPELNAVVSQKVEIAPGLIILRIIPDGWPLPDFSAGQFTVIGLPGLAPRFQYSEPDSETPDQDKLIRRAYSISSSSKEKEYIEFYIRLVSSGSLTPRLFALNVRDKVWLSPKFTGMFTLDKIPADKNVIFFATGTGIAPYMSMLRSSVISQENRNYAVVHGALNSWDLGYRSELITIERLCPNFNYIPIISAPENEPIKWNGLTGFNSNVWEIGYIQDKWKMDITADNTHFLLCGNPNMITGMVDLLQKEGYKEDKKTDPGQIHLERFW